MGTSDGDAMVRHQLLDAVGPLCVTLRNWWVLAIVTFGGAAAAVVTPVLFVDKDGRVQAWVAPWAIGLGIAAAVAVLLDRAADVFESRLQASRLASSEDAAETSVHDLNTLLGEAIRTAYVERGARAAHIDTLERTAAVCAARSLGDGGRASYYPMEREGSGWRRLTTPRHGHTRSRSDAPMRPFVEEEDPGHDIWKILDREDLEAAVHTAPEPVYGVDWSKKQYKTFVSVPVKAAGAQFGLLSANSSEKGAIVGPQRAVVIAMARVMALVHAFDTGTRTLNAKQGADVLSEQPPTIQMGEEDRDDEQ